MMSIPKKLVHAFACSFLLVPTISQALEVTKSKEWLEEDPLKQYYYVDLIPEDDHVSKLLEILLDNKWRLDVVGSSNSSSSFKARLVSEHPSSTNLPFNFNKNWYAPALKSKTVGYILKGTPEEINDFILKKQKSGYKSFSQASGGPRGVYKYSFIKD